jgi:hypothetical protein
MAIVSPGLWNVGTVLVSLLMALAAGWVCPLPFNFRPSASMGRQALMTLMLSVALTQPNISLAMPTDIDRILEERAMQKAELRKIA